MTLTLSAALLTTVAACGGAGDGGGDAAAAGTSAGAGTAESADSATVDIKTFAFGPKELRIAKGTTVTWTNTDSILHTVTSGTRKADAMGQPTDVRKDGRFDFRLDGKGSSSTYTFDETGTFTYFCDLHPGMDASVVVS